MATPKDMQAAEGRTAAGSTGQSVLHFLLALVIPCSVVVYLLFMQEGTASLKLHYDQARAQHPDLTFLIKVVTDWGNVAFYPVYATILLLGYKRGRPGWRRFAWAYLVVQLLISFALVRLLKIGMGCPRPDVEGLCLPFSFDPGHHSLPSGHTAEVAGAALPLAMRAQKLWFSLLMGAFVALMAYSRVFLGWHHPADIAFGLAFGSYAAWLIHSYGS